MLAHQRAKGKMFMSNLIVSNFPLKVKKMNEFNVSNLLLGVLLGAIIFGIGLFYMMTHPPKQEDLTLNAEPIVEQTEEIPEIPEELTGGHETVEVTVAEEVKEEKKPILSDEEIIAMVVDIEAGVDADMIAKVAVASVVLNRCDAWGMTVESVIYQKDQFAIAKSYTADDLRAVEIAQKARDLFPSNMLYFRNKQYHSFGVPYMEIGGNYFSLSESEETE